MDDLGAILTRARDFVDSMYDPGSGGYRSVPEGRATLYGTVYALLTRYYLGVDEAVRPETAELILGSQEPGTGFFVGPELRGWSPDPSAVHDREHLLLHLVCATLPACQQLRLTPRHPLGFAHRFCDERHLAEWLDARVMTDPWLEGNNLLFVGQLLVYLRDVEGHHGAADALARWFRWLDDRVDPATGLWGTDTGASAFAALYGGYHQLLVYYHEDHPLPSPQRLVDTVLALQQPDGGFSGRGGGGACEDVDAVDVLVNLHKRHDYRRSEIRAALARCRSSILATRGADGGFPYKRDAAQSHLGIPDTRAGENVSTMFATWFRVHTLGLIAQVLGGSPPIRFNSSLSMGWHRTSPAARADPP